jgi:hypothetical protein
MDAPAMTPAEKAMGEIGQRLASIGATKLPPDDEAPAPAKPAKAPALKLFVSYKEGDDESLHMATKFVVPKGWRPGPVSKLLAFVVDTYNGKRAGNALDAAACHLEVGGLALGSEEVVEAVLKPRDEVLLRPGASLARGERALAAAAAEADARARADAARRAREGKVRCLNHGCGTLFDPDDNPAGACAHHRAPPFVSGGYKGWRCSGQDKRAKFPTSKAHISAVFHSFRLIFGRAIISWNGLEAWMLEAWMLFPERARAENSC